MIMEHQFLTQLLSFREKQILKHIASGKLSKQIADDLQISKNTVDTHRRNMIQKANAQNTTELVERAYLEGLFKRLL